MSLFFDQSPVLYTRSFDKVGRWRVQLTGVQFEARFLFACTGYIQQEFTL